MSYRSAHRGSRLLGVAMIALAVSPWGMWSPQAQAQSTAASLPPPACSHALQPGDQHTFACELPTSATQAYTFSVSLSGGHDDSSSALSLSWQGQALACEDGSKTTSDGEFGDIVLSCRFKLPPDARGPKPAPLAVQLKASHVVLEGLRLQAD